MKKAPVFIMDSAEFITQQACPFHVAGYLDVHSTSVFYKAQSLRQAQARLLVPGIFCRTESLFSHQAEAEVLKQCQLTQQQKFGLVPEPQPRVSECWVRKRKNKKIKKVHLKFRKYKVSIRVPWKILYQFFILVS